MVTPMAVASRKKVGARILFYLIGAPLPPTVVSKKKKKKKKLSPTFSLKTGSLNIAEYNATQNRYGTRPCRCSLLSTQPTL